MTPTTSEREARELLAREYERSDLKIAAAILRDKRENEATRAAIRAIIAALAREQREVPPGLYDLDPYVLPQQEALCPCGGPAEKCPGGCGPQTSGAQQEAQGAVVCRLHPRYKAKLPPRSTAVGCICAEIYNHKHPAPPSTTKPAPVPVKAQGAVAYTRCKHDQWADQCLRCNLPATPPAPVQFTDISAHCQQAGCQFMTPCGFIATANICEVIAKLRSNESDLRRDGMTAHANTYEHCIGLIESACLF